ncbi:MAG: CoA-binding protein [Chloroflexi bacterium]|nr:CoA-binding protein [Chloroflexota bacterium]
MREMFYPKKVAVVGVSLSEDNLARNILRNLLKFKFPGETYAIGAKVGEIYRKPIYTSPLDLPADVDFAAILIPARFVPKTLDDLGRKGVRNALISSGGFGEYSEEGRELGRQVLEVARKWNIRFLGPNCLGISNLDNGLILPFAPMDPAKLLKGPNSIIAQSGGVKMRCMSLFSEEGVGFNKVISIGNKLNVDEVDLLDYLSTDSSTSTILMYLEDIRRGRRLVEVARRCKKPIVLMKANTSPVTADIAKSHTAALASDDSVVDGALRQAGVVRVREIESFIVCAKAFALPPLHGNDIVVISPSGGFAVISADVAGAYGFNLPKLPPQVVANLEKGSRARVIRFTNPVDFGDVYDRGALLYTVETILKDAKVSGMAVTVPTGGGSGGMGFSGPDAEKLLQGIKDISLGVKKPVAAAVFGGQDQLPGMMRAAQFPIFKTINEAVMALAVQRDYYRQREALGLA